MVRGDQYFMGVCNKSGAIAIYNPNNNLFLSPFSDGPLVFNKNLEGQLVLDAISKFGRSFSIVRIPYALKLLIQELQVMNVQMRVITEENIDQLLNLSYQSRNIDKLLYVDHGEDGKIERDIKDIIENYKKPIDKLIQKQNDTIKALKAEAYQGKYIRPEPIEPRGDLGTEVMPETPEVGLEGSEYSLPKIPTGTPDFAPGIYAMVPPETSPSETTPSPVYIPEGSPAYMPDMSASKGGSVANVFTDPYLNNAFNQLGGNQQAQILQLPAEQRGGVMSEILRRSAKQQGGGITNNNPVNNNPLNNAFEALPQDKQLVALQGGYHSMAKEFNSLSKIVNDPLITINKPISMTQQLADRFPILATQTGGDKDKDKDKNLEDNDTNKSSSSNNDNISNDGNINVKKLS